MTTNIQNHTDTPMLKGERCQCASCGFTFVGLRAFDRHRTGEFGLPKGHAGNRRCRTFSEMLAAGMEESAKGLWRIESKRPTVPQLSTEASEPRVDITRNLGSAAGEKPSETPRWVRLAAQAELSL